MQLRVHVIKAILTHNTQIGSEMDPFVVLKLGTQQRKGKTFQEAGDLPVFDERFDFLLGQQNPKLHLIVYDEDMTVDDLVGEVEIDLKSIIIQPFTEKRWYSLKYNGKKPAGKIMLQFQCRKNGRVEAPSTKQVKEILKPNIHPIGIIQSDIKTGKLYGQQEDFHTTRTLGNSERNVVSVHSLRSHKNLPVYSFRNNSRMNEHKDWQNSSMQNVFTGTHISTISNNSEISSSTSSKRYVATYAVDNTNSYNKINRTPYQNKNVSNSYQQSQYPQFHYLNRNVKFRVNNTVNCPEELVTYGKVNNCLRRY